MSRPNTSHSNFITVWCNEIVAIVSRFLTEVQHYSRHMTLWNEERRRNAYVEHNKVYQAICSRSPEAARKAMYEHLAKAQKVLPTAPGVVEADAAIAAAVTDPDKNVNPKK